MISPERELSCLSLVCLSDLRKQLKTSLHEYHNLIGYGDLNKSELLPKEKKMQLYMDSFQSLHTLALTEEKLYGPTTGESWFDLEVHAFMPQVYFLAWLTIDPITPAKYRDKPVLSYGAVLRKPEPVLNAVSYFLNINRDQLKEKGLVTTPIERLQADAEYSLNCLSLPA